VSTPKLIKIGRDPLNDIVLMHRSISRFHVEVFVNEEGQVFITDLQSSNGTYINGQKISKSRILEPGDILRLGVEKPLRWQKWLSQSKTVEGKVDIGQDILDDSFPTSPSGFELAKKYFYFAVVIFLSLAILFILIKKVDERKRSSTKQTSSVEFTTDYTKRL
jgi:hypothetical protein